MRDADRIGPMLWELGKLWSDYPDQRLGQLIGNLTRRSDSGFHDIFNIEDDDMLDLIKKGFSP
jgi:hypothetical protein